MDDPIIHSPNQILVGLYLDPLPSTEALVEKEALRKIDEDLDEFSHWVETEMSGPIRAPLHPSERAIIKTYLIRKLLPDKMHSSNSR